MTPAEALARRMHDAYLRHGDEHVKGGVTSRAYDELPAWHRALYLAVANDLAAQAPASRMTHGRMRAHVLVAGWIGALTAVGWWNFTDARWGHVAVNVALMAAAGALLVAMGRADHRRERITS